MKKFIPYFVLALGALWIGSTLAPRQTESEFDLDGFGPDAMTVVFAFAAIERLAGHVETYLYSTGASPADTEATVNALAAAVRETLKRRLAT